MKKNNFFTLTVAYYVSSAIAFFTMFIAVNNLDKSLLSTVLSLVIISNIWAAVSVYNLNIAIFTEKKVFQKVKQCKGSIIFWNIALGICFYGYLFFTHKTEIFISLTLLVSVYFFSYLLSARSQFTDNISASCFYVLLPNIVKMLAVVLLVFGVSSFEYLNLCFFIILIVLLYVFLSEYTRSKEPELIKTNRDHTAELSYSISLFTNMLILYMPQFLSMNRLSPDLTVSILNSLVLVQASIVPLNTYLNRFWIASSDNKIFNTKLNVFTISVIYGFCTAFIVIIMYRFFDRYFELNEHIFPVNFLLILILPLKCAQQYLLVKSSVDGRDKNRLFADTCALMLYVVVFLFTDIDFNKFIFIVFFCEFFHLIVLAGLNVLSRTNRSI